MTETRTVRVGTRGSALALWQAETVAALVREHDPGVDAAVEVIKTTGDRIQDVALAKLPGKAFFTKEIEDALSDGRIDIAVHSGKDVPTENPEDLVLAGFISRHAPNDAIVSRSGCGLMELPQGARVGTSSVRRGALVRQLRPDITVLNLRGNVDTRLAKLDAGDYDAILLALAGIERLGRGDRVTALMDLEQFPPAVCQGAVAVQIRRSEATLAGMLAAVVDSETTRVATAERALLAALEGGCQVPLGALCVRERDRLCMHASLIAPDGSSRVDGRLEGDVGEPEQLGRALADQLRSLGGAEILKMSRVVGP